MSENDAVTVNGAGHFVRLLTQHERRVYAYILSLVGNWADADDVLQETNVQLWNEFAKFVPESDFAAWACTIARYQVLTFRKRKRRERVQFSDAFIDIVAREIALPEDVSGRERALECCIGRLSPENRDLLRVYYAPDATVKDIAERFQRTVPALYKSLSRIRRALHECIERQLSQQVRA